MMTDKEKGIRINNTFSSASKQNKEIFLKKWNDFKNYVADNPQFFNIYGLLNDIEVLVVGDKNIMFLASYDSILTRLFENISSIERVLNDFYNNEYKIIFLSDDQWNSEKKRYVSNIKKGVKYSYIHDENDILEGEYVPENLDSTELDGDVDKITSILGENVISFE